MGKRVSKTAALAMNTFHASVWSQFEELVPICASVGMWITVAFREEYAFLE